MKKIFIFYLLFSGIVSGRQIVVPTDKLRTIQSGIDAAQMGDTVVVKPGIYHESIKMSIIPRPNSGGGPGITLASFYIYHRDADYIGKTIIQGLSGKPAIKIEQFMYNVYHTLLGFSIENSSSGLALLEAKVHLENMVFKNNEKAVGASITVLTMKNVLICQNSQALRNYSVHQVLENVVIIDNKESISTVDFGRITLKNCTIANNHSPIQFNYYRSRLECYNSILWNKSAVEIAFLYDQQWELEIADSCFFGNSCVKNGFSGISFVIGKPPIMWLTGNLTLYPQFADTTNSDFHLSDSSPCIGQGSREYMSADSDFDGVSRPFPPGSQPDMGAFENPLGSALSVQSKEEVNSHYIFDHYPNPFNETINITYSLPNPQNVHIAIYNLRGQIVKVIVDEFQTQGDHRITWNSGQLSSGIYLMSFSADQYQKIMRTTCLK